MPNADKRLRELKTVTCYTVYTLNLQILKIARVNFIWHINVALEEL